jgi:hypothetical protein
VTRHAHLSLLDAQFRDQYEIAADRLLEEYLAKVPPATDELGEADNVARAHGFTVHQLTTDDHGLPPRLYVHRPTAAALFWTPGIPTAEQAQFGRAAFLGGMAWGAGTAVDLYGVLRLHASTGNVRQGTSAAVTQWLRHHRATRRSS